jgi:hypothetical protein
MTIFDAHLNLSQAKSKTLEEVGREVSEEKGEESSSSGSKESKVDNFSAEKTL